MKNVLFLIVILMSNISISQAIYRKDYIETFDADWSGLWFIPAATTNYYTNAFVSSTSSAVIYGAGNASSAIEQDWYSFPNLAVNPVNDYYLTFRLGSYRFTSTATTRGVDAADYITVQLSTNGGTSYVNELRITGASNAFWDYNSSSYTKTANGTLTTISPAAGGNRTSTGDGYSNIRLNIPPATSNIAIDIYCRVNSAGEEWWLDNFELHEIINTPLPVELIYFEGKAVENNAVLVWETASESNSYYYEIQRTVDGENWKVVGIINAAGNSNQKLRYDFVDKNLDPMMYYYRLNQVDNDGKNKLYDITSVEINSNKSYQFNYYTMDGQKIDIEKASAGIYIREFNGVIDKI